MENERNELVEPGEINMVDARSPEGIRLHRFDTVKRGYDPGEVREFLDRVASWFEELTKQLQERELEMQEARLQRDALWGQPRKTEDPYSRAGERVAEILRTADEQAQDLRREAEHAAELLRAEAEERIETLERAAREEADRLRGAAEEEVAQTRAEAERLMAALSGRRIEVLDQLESVRAHLLEVEGRLEQGMRTLRGEETGTPARPRAGGEDAGEAGVLEQGGAVEADDEADEELVVAIPDFLGLEEDRSE